MKKVKVILSVFLVLASSFWFINKPSSDEASRLPQSLNSHLVSKPSWIQYFKGVSELNQIWMSGDYPYLEEMSCKNFHWKSLEKSVSREYLKCNPDAFRCFLDELKRTHDGVFSFEDKEKKRQLHILKSNKIHPNGVQIKVSYQDIQKNILLESRCKETYLPQSEYLFSPLNYGMDIPAVKREKSKAWKNDKNIFIDKFLVSYLDLKEISPRKYEKEIQEQKGKFFRTVSTLSLSEMKLFCEKQGKKLLTAKLYDAMNIEGKDIKSLLSQVKPDNCSEFYHKDCVLKKKVFKSWDTNNVSNIGTYDIRGGVLEIVDNEENPFFNVIASSMYFSAKSYWHNLTHRFHWDGKGFSESHFDFRSSITGEKLKGVSGENIKVGFRCYREL